MKIKKHLKVLIAIVCIISATGVLASTRESTREIPEDAVIVYDDGEWTALMSKEQYDTLSESTKENLDDSYKKIIELMEKRDKK